MKLIQYTKIVNIGKLQLEISSANCVENFTGINTFVDDENNAIVEIFGDNILSSSVLDTVLSQHDSSESLIEKKSKKCEEIDKKTTSLIALGFTFDFHHFSLSKEAQQNWMSLKALEVFYTFPVALGTFEGNEYQLSLVNMPIFVATGLGTVKSHLDSGRTLKVQVNACQTIQELENIIDNR